MQPKHLLPLALFAGLSLACSSTRSEPEREQATGEEQALRVRQAQVAAREAAVADLYEQWRYEYVTYRKAVDEALAAAQPSEPVADPVRSVEELLRESDPEANDPALQDLRAEWLAASEKYDLRLRQLANDPELDPRSPLHPEVRAALEPQPSPK
jgi:hypothetical protein